MNIDFKTLQHNENDSIQIVKEILTHHFELQKLNGNRYRNESERQAIIKKILSPFLYHSKTYKRNDKTTISDVGIKDFPAVYLPSGKILTVFETLVHILDPVDYQKIAYGQDINLSDWEDLVKYATTFGGSLPIPEYIREDSKKSYLEHRYDAVMAIAEFIDEHIPKHAKDFERTPLNFILSFSTMSRDKEDMLSFISQAESDRLTKEEKLLLSTQFRIVGSSQEAQDKIAELIEPLLIKSNQCFSSSFSPVFNRVETKFKNGERKLSWEFSISDDYNVASEYSGVRALGECVGGMKNKKLNSLLLMDSIMYALTMPHDSVRKPLGRITEALANSDIKDTEDERMASLFKFLDSLSEKVDYGIKYASIYDYEYDQPDSPPIQINKWDYLTETIINAIRQTVRIELKNIEIRKIDKKGKFVNSDKSRRPRKIVGISL